MTSIGDSAFSVWPSEHLSYVDVSGMRALRGRSGQPLTLAGASAPVLRLVDLLGWDTDPTVEVAA